MFSTKAIEQSLAEIGTEINKHGRAPGRTKSDPQHALSIIYETSGVSCEISGTQNSANEPGMILFVKVFRNKQTAYRLEYTYVAREVNNQVRWYQRFRPELGHVSGVQMGASLFGSMQELVEATEDFSATPPVVAPAHAVSHA